MKRREFLSVPALLPLLANDGASSVFGDRMLAEPHYEELLRSAHLVASSNLVTDELVGFMLEAIAGIEPRETAVAAAMGFAQIAAQDGEFISDVDAYLHEFNGPKDALDMIESQPDVFLQRPAVRALSDRIAGVIRHDAGVFLAAADRLGTANVGRHLPPDLTIHRDKDEIAKESEENCPRAAIRVIVSIILLIVAIVIAAVTFGAASGAVVAAAVLAGATIGSATGAGEVKDKIERAEADLIEGITRSVSRRSVIYARAARKTAKDCLKLQDPIERRACLEAALLICANAY